MSAAALSWLGIGFLGAAIVIAACGSSGATSSFSSSTPSASAPPTSTPSPAITKPAQSQPALLAPTHIAWAIDHTDQPGRYLFELHYDGTAMGFRVVDDSGRPIVVLPIAGSGIFGPETCMATAKKGTDGATWVGVDESTYRDLLLHAASYRVEIETIGHGTITLPLVDTGCRRS